MADSQQASILFRYILLTIKNNLITIENKLKMKATQISAFGLVTVLLVTSIISCNQKSTETAKST
jgi:hypothetical protein